MRRMDWISTFGRRLLIAYTEGLAMNCPHHLAECGSQKTSGAPLSVADIGMRAGDVGIIIQQTTTVRH